MDILGHWVFEGLPLLYLTLLLLRDVCCTGKGSIPQSSRQWEGQNEHPQQKFTSNIGKNGWVGVYKRVYQTIPYLPLKQLIF